MTAGGDLDAGVKLRGRLTSPRSTPRPATCSTSARSRRRAMPGWRPTIATSGTRYKARFAADCKDLDVAGLTAAPIHRDLARVDASAVGPRSADGMPPAGSEAAARPQGGRPEGSTWPRPAGRRDRSRSRRVGVDVASPVPGPGRGEGGVRRSRAGPSSSTSCAPGSRRPTRPPPRAPWRWRSGGGSTWPRARGRSTPIPGTPVGAVGLAAEGLKVSGLGRADAPLRVDAALVGDLAALDRLLAAWSGSPPEGPGRDLAGRASGSRGRSRARLDVDGQVDVADITAMGLRGPVSLAWKGGYAPETDRVELGGIDLATGYGLAALAGNLYERKGRRIYDLMATLEPRWEAIDPIVAASVGPNARLRATVRPIRWKGRCKADSTPQLLAQQIARGRARPDRGPGVRRDAGAGAGGPAHGRRPGGVRPDPDHGQRRPGRDHRQPGASTTRTASGSGSPRHRRSRGRRSTTRSRRPCWPTLRRSWRRRPTSTARCPSTSTGPRCRSRRRARWRSTGQVVFQDVQFLPGPLGDRAGLDGRPARRRSWRSTQPMQLQVADGRVRQSGLSIPIGGGREDRHRRLGGLRPDPGPQGVGPADRPDARARPEARQGRRPAPSWRSRSGGRWPARRSTAGRCAVALRDAARSAAGQGLKAEAGGLLHRVAGPNPPGGEPRASPAVATRSAPWRTWAGRSSTRRSRDLAPPAGPSRRAPGPLSRARRPAMIGADLDARASPGGRERCRRDSVGGSGWRSGWRWPRAGRPGPRTGRTSS